MILLGVDMVKSTNQRDKQTEVTEVKQQAT